jgi:hypothetical protein
MAFTTGTSGTVAGSRLGRNLRLTAGFSALFAGWAIHDATVAHAQSPTAAVDVVGIKLGMAAADAVAAIKADNPRLGIHSQTLVLEGFDQPMVTAIVGDQAGEAGKDKEELQLLVTTPPARPVVWGIQRTYYYTPQNSPSLDNALAGLRKKYGPENAYFNPDPRVMTKVMSWVYDLNGKPLGDAEAHTLFLACDAFLAAHFNPVALRNDLDGTNRPSECSSIILATATLQSGRLVTDESIVVSNLIFRVNNGALYRASIEATRAVALAAAKVRQEKHGEAVDQRGPPKL